MKALLSLFLAMYLLLSPALAKEKKVTFDAQAARTYIKDLAADSMEGRESGEKGGQLAAQYIASKLREWGLEPVFQNGDYLQNFAAEHQKVEEGAALQIRAGKAMRDFYYGEDWSVWSFSGSGNFTTEIVFGGYGIHAPRKAYDDYAGIDIKGKLVLFMMGVPPQLEETLKEEADMQQRIKAAQELGARGVLFCVNPAQRNGSNSWRLKKEIYQPGFVIIYITEKITSFIFRDLKTESRYLLQGIDESSKPQPYETGVKAFVSVRSIFDEKRPMCNVMGKISGSDRELRNECVMIGAHMDHLGVEPMGEIMHGADDNASGTATVMEIARIMKLNKVKPRRTVVFALWAGEEQFLLGSKYYTDHPVYPLEKTVVYLNFDMVGQGKEKVNFENVYYAPKIWSLLKEKLPKDILDNLNPIRESTAGTSDYDSFLEKGIPGFAIMTEGNHLKYHQSRDEIDLIQPQILKTVGDFGAAALNILANEPGNWILSRRQENFYLKQVFLTDFKPLPLDETIENLKDIEAPVIDLQLAVVEEKEGLSGDALRLDILKRLLSAKANLQSSQHLSYFSSSRSFRQGVYREGKTTIIPGLKGMNSFRDDPGWLEILAKQGIFFVILDHPSFLFDQTGLNEEGKKMLEALNKNGLLMMVRGLEPSQSKVLLEASKKPFVLLEKQMPSKENMDLIKKRGSGLGLLLSQEEEPAAYFRKLDEAKQAIGSECLLIVNENSLWESAGMEKMKNLISEILKAKYEWLDIVQPFSRTFLRVLDKNRE